MNWYLAVLKNYVGFSGRARRKEYWMFTLFNVIFSFILGVVDGIVFGGGENSIGVFGLIYSLAVFLPSLAVSARRLHDIDRTAWWLLLCLVPIVGWLVLLVFAMLEGSKGDNRFGPDPKEGE